MKKFIYLFLFSLLLACPITSNASVAYVGIDDSLVLSEINSLSFDIYGVSSTDDFSLSIIHTDETVSIDGVETAGAVAPDVNLPYPYDFLNGPTWEFYKATNPTIGVIGFKVSADLSEGILARIESQTYNFTIGNLLLGSDVEDGKYPYPYSLSIKDYEEATLYTASNVPIPPAIILLGSGILGLIGFKRRSNKK